MERRVQSLVDVLSSVYHFLQEQKNAAAAANGAVGASNAAGNGGSGDTLTSWSCGKRPRGGGRYKGKGKPGGNGGAGGGGACGESDHAMEISSEVAGDASNEGGSRSNGELAASKVEGGCGDGAGAGRNISDFSAKPPLELLGDAEVVEALWGGKQSMMRRLLKKLESVYSEKCVVVSPEDGSDRDEEGETGVAGSCGVQVGWGARFVFFMCIFVVVFFFFGTWVQFCFWNGPLQCRTCPSVSTA